MACVESLVVIEVVSGAAAGSDGTAGALAANACVVINPIKVPIIAQRPNVRSCVPTCSCSRFIFSSRDIFLNSLRVRAWTIPFKRNQRLESLVSPKRQAAQTWPPFFLELTPAADSLKTIGCDGCRDQLFFRGKAALVPVCAISRKESSKIFKKSF
jgi:hypothetical protein